MRLNIVKSKNAEQLYIIKSIRKEGKSTARIVKKLGTMASLLPRFDHDQYSEEELLHTLRDMNVHRLRIYGI